MLARRLTTILRAIPLPEALATTYLLRVAGRTGVRGAFITTHPCRAPPYTISDMGLVGGGHVPLPGEVSACLLGQPSCDRRARALPRKRRCLLRFGIDNHDNAGATAGDGRNIQ